MLRVTALLGVGLVAGLIVGYAIFGIEQTAITDSDNSAILAAIGTSVAKQPPTPTATATVYADTLPLCFAPGVGEGDPCLQVYEPGAYFEVCSDLHWARRPELAVPCQKAADLGP